MASAKAKIRHVFGDTFSCRAAPPDIISKAQCLRASDVQSLSYSSVFVSLRDFQLIMQNSSENIASRQSRCIYVNGCHQPILTRFVSGWL